MTNISTQAPAAVVLSAVATVKRGRGRPVTQGDTRPKVTAEIKTLVAKRGGTTYGMGLAQLRLAELQAIRDNEKRVASTH